MFWLYFMRDFYQPGGAAPAQAASQPRRLRSRTATVAFRYPETSPTPATPKASQPLRVTPLAVHSEPVTKTDSLHTYLHRLNIEGEHAFGVWDEDAGFTLFSANFERVTGLLTGECAGHEWIHSIYHEQQYAVNEALLAAQSGTDGRCLVQAQRLIGAEDMRWLLIDIKAPTLRQPGTMVLFRDLTDQKALEEALKQTESALALSERGRAAFLASMSHELRTPLNAIMGFSEMMKSGVFGDLENKTYAQYAHHIHDSGTTLLGKINDLLEIASMDSGGLALEEAEFPLSGLLHEVMEIHSHRAFSREQQLKLDCPLAGLAVYADRAKLLCAISHLITNAMRHSKAGAEITVGVRVHADDGVVISVRDAGEGISHAQLDGIRTALGAVTTYYHMESGGIGLGLSLAKELTQRHGGRVMIDSIRHRGTVVSLILPVARVTSGMPQKRRMS